MRSFCVVTFAWLVLLAACDSEDHREAVHETPPASTADTTEDSKPRLSAAMCSAVLLSLDDFFSDNWSDGVVFIEPHPCIPDSIDFVGRYSAEVISADKLKSRFKGEDRAPTLAVIHTYDSTKDGDRRFNVEIDYQGVPVEGAKEIPLGGGMWYVYAIKDGKFTLLQREFVAH